MGARKRLSLALTLVVEERGNLLLFCYCDQGLPLIGGKLDQRTLGCTRPFCLQTVKQESLLLGCSTHGGLVLD